VAGREEFILKDPLSQRFFRVGPIEWFVARQLNGRHTLDDLCAAVVMHYPEAGVPRDEVRRFVLQLAAAGMLRLGGHQEIDRLLDQRRRGRFGRWLNVAGSVFYFRVPLASPDALVTRLAERVAPLMRPATLLVAAALVLTALALILWQWPRLVEPQAEFLSPLGLLYLVGTLLVIKVLHEFGHALVCKHFGGHVTEVGLAFVAFAPCFYCDVSDAWLFRSRWRRLAVSAAGIAVELVLAALATLVFFLTRPGGLHQAAFSLMVAGGLSTLLFNGNPLLRFDGYYLLSDALEVPNLRLRARLYVAALARWALFGVRPSDAEGPDRYRAVFIVYAVVSYIYSWAILYVILGLIYARLEPYGLQTLAGALVVLALALQLGPPLWQLLAALFKLLRTPGHLSGFVRPAAIVAVLALALAGVAAVPFDETLSRTCVVEPLDPADLRATQSGFVAEVRVRAASCAEAGDVLLVLDNADLALALRQAGAERREAQLLLARAQADGSAADIQKLQLRANQADDLVRAAQQAVDELTIRAPRRGLVLADDLRNLRGRYVRKGDTLLRLAPPGEVKVTLELPERDAERVAVGSLADLRVSAATDRAFAGRVVGNALAASSRPAAVLTTRYAGDVPVRQTDQGWEAAVRLYRTELAVRDAGQVLRPGMSGRARIHLGRQTVGGWLLHAACDQLSLDVLLRCAGGGHPGDA
jgi:putative peptide zinc metalloprotease protein